MQYSDSDSPDACRHCFIDAGQARAHGVEPRLTASTFVYEDHTKDSSDGNYKYY